MFSLAMSALAVLNVLYVCPEMSLKVLRVSLMTFSRWSRRTCISGSLPCLQACAYLIFRSSSLLWTTTGLVVIRSLVGVLPLLLACDSDSRWLVARSSNSVNLKYFFLKLSFCFSTAFSGLVLCLLRVLDPDGPRYWVGKPRESNSSWRSVVVWLGSLFSISWFDGRLSG